MDLTRTLSEVERLRQEWLRTDARRAGGGYAALSGFHFQLASTLLDRVGAWCELPREDRASIAIFDEMISDALTATAGEIVITQSKLTGTSTRLHAALGELWTVDVAARRLDPALAVPVRYQVRVARLAAPETALEQWQPAGAAADDADVASFRRRVTLCTVADPERELIVLLANRLGDRQPLDSFERWLGRLVSAAARGEGLRQAADEIWRDLWRLDQAAEVADGIVLWSDADIPPAQVVHGGNLSGEGYLSGERPRLFHLRDGYFADRPDVYTQLAATLGEWVVSSPALNDRSARLPVFWIGGRSGSGKSVALLHVLATLYQEGHGPILWLGDKVGNLRKALETARAFARKGVQTLVALDDPYSPSAHNNAQEVWREALDSLESLRQVGDVAELPLVVCCGPNEQGERFQEDFRDDVQVTTREVPQESHADLTAIREWFFARTGRHPPELGNENILLVQLFFEWRVKVTLPDFARRLRLRILDEDASGHLLEFMAVLFASNRLYVGLPAGAVSGELSPAEQGMMRRLRDENHLIESERSGRREVWLQHPHLSNAIYESWYAGSGNDPVRAAHLRRAVEITLRYGETPPEKTAVLWAVARALLAGGGEASDVVGRIDQASLPEVLAGVYAQAFEAAGAAPPIWLLPVWIALQARTPGLRLEPDPVDVALREIVPANRAQTGFRLTCHLLLQHLARLARPRQEQVAHALVRVLRAGTDWYEWQPVAQDALLRTGDRRFASLVADWALQHPSDPRVPRLLESGLRRLPNHRELVACALRLLDEAPGTPPWGDLGIFLWEESGQERPPRDVVRWVERNRLEFGCCYLLGRMLRTPDSLWPAWGFAWARRWHLERTANFVLEPLFRTDPANGQIAAWCRAWLAAGYPAGGFLMESLLKHRPGDPEVLALAAEWLRSSFADPSWGYVWRAYGDRIGDPQAATALVFEWLAKAPAEHGSWKFLWETLWESGEAREELRALGLAWLERAPAGHGSWVFLWETLWEGGTEHADLEALGLAWLERAPVAHGSWVFLWSKLWDAGNAREALRVLGLAWLGRAPAEHGSWWYLWETLWESGEAHEELRGLGLAWLERAPAGHGSWKFLWETLWESGEAREELRDLGLAWLEKAPVAHGSWWYLWETLWESGEAKEELRDLGLAWLGAAPAEHGSWKYLWEALWESGEVKEELRDLGLAWLAKAPAEHGSWVFLWNRLWDGGEAHDVLRPLGLAWLERAPAEHGSWVYLWGKSWESGEAHDQLRDLALAWLGKAPAEHGSWQYLWEKLWQSGEAHEELQRLGLVWLGEAPAEHGSWAFLWESLWESGEAREEVRALGLAWLGKAPVAHGSWVYQWGKLWEDEEARDELRALGLAWLESAPAEHGSWQYLWSKLWEGGDAREVLRPLGLAWLERAPAEHGSWKYLWETLWESGEVHEELRDLGLAWLRAAPAEHGSWVFLWGRLWEGGEAHDELRALGLTWLGRAPAEHGSWNYLWSRLWESGQEHDALRALGLAWLAEAPAEHGSWKYLWETLWESGEARDEVRALGLAWLEKTPAAHASWVFLWETLWESGEAREELWSLGMAWLGEAPVAHGSWVYLWDKLWNVGQAHDELRALGLAWLESAPARHGSWQYLWSALWEADGERDRLRRLGLAWLENVPGHGSWQFLWAAMWDAGEARDELRRLGREWLANASGSLAAPRHVHDRLAGEMPE